MTNLPRYMAVGTNKQINDAVQATISGSKDAINLAITALEAIINFFIDSYRSSFLCFIELIVHGALGVLIFAVQEVCHYYHVKSTPNTINTAPKLS